MERCTALGRTPLRPNAFRVATTNPSSRRTFHLSTSLRSTSTNPPSSLEPAPRPAFRIIRTSDDQPHRQPAQANNRPRGTVRLGRSGRPNRTARSTRPRAGQRDNDDGETWKDLMRKLNAGVRPPAEAQPFTPEVFTAAALITNRTAVASGTSAAAKASVQGAMARLGRRDDTSFANDAELARRFGRGEVMRFKDGDERMRVVALAEEYADDIAGRRGRKKDMYVETEKVGFQSVSGAHRGALVDKVLKGKYEDLVSGEGTGRDGDAYQAVQKALTRNETYHPTAGKGFMDMLAKFMPLPSKAAPKAASKASSKASSKAASKAEPKSEPKAAAKTTRKRKA